VTCSGTRPCFVDARLERPRTSPDVQAPRLQGRVPMVPPTGTGSPDPIGDILAWVPVALAVVGAIVAILPSGIVFFIEALAKRHRVPALEPSPGGAH
jgi:hypothetical protein